MNYTKLFIIIIILVSTLLSGCVKKDLSISEKCESLNGVWIDEYSECEVPSRAACNELGGNYNGCESACRHDPDAQVCTAQCIQVCSFNR